MDFEGSDVMSGRRRGELLEKLLGAGCMGPLLELRGWCYHTNDGAKRAVWMYLVFLVRRASSVLYFYNLLHSN